MSSKGLTPEEKLAKRRQQKLDWYHRNADKVNKERKSKYNADTKEAIIAAEAPLKVKSSALNQSKYMQHYENFRKHTYTEWQENKTFRPEGERFQPKSGIYRVKYQVSQQMPSIDLNTKDVKEPPSDKISKPLGLRKTVEGTGMPWSKNGKSFAHDYVWRKD